MTKFTRGLLALLAVPAWLACSEVTFEGGGPLSFTLTADRTTAAPGDSITFSYNAVGSIIAGVVMDYGDGTADSLNTSGAQTASGRFVHAFSSAGSYTVVGTLIDNLQGPASDQVVVQVGGE